jgi:hypothetical protein
VKKIFIKFFNGYGLPGGKVRILKGRIKYPIVGDIKL